MPLNMDLGLMKMAGIQDPGIAVVVLLYAMLSAIFMQGNDFSVTE